jgi:hypothetical protein
MDQIFYLMSSVHIDAVEAPADLRPVFIDGAASGDQKFTVVVDHQAMGPDQAELQSDGAQILEPPVLIPGQGDIREGAAAGSAACLTALVSVLRLVE